MKPTLIFSLALLLAISTGVRAAVISKDTQELRLQGTLDPTSVNGSDIRVNVSYGYFFEDNVQAGARVDIEDNDRVSRIGLGGFAEFNFDTETDLMPFGEFYAGLANVDVEGSGGDNLAGIIELRAGAKYFLSENVAVAAAGVFAYATEKIYPDKSKLRDVDAFIELSIRCYF